MALYDDVYGLTYQAARRQTDILNEEIKRQVGVGFSSLEELEEWAHDHLLDKVVYMNMSHKFFCVSHKGELLLPASFSSYYSSLLFWSRKEGKKTVDVPWVPDGFKYYDKAYAAAEQTDGVHKPLYYRDYVVPSGYYNPDKDAFNVAKPFEVYAEETGADTSHVYTFIEHIAGECAPWLLAWLRAKLLHPTVKTQVVPVILSRAQGSGKTTFAEVICKGLFGKDNVLVTDQYDSQSRFNADYADALIVCQEEKEETDRRNPAGALKSRATATTIRKEQKGVDPIYQESYTDFIMTTNKDVPIKFDGREDQRRFMIMSADEHFTRKESELADEVFTKLYGFDANYVKKGTPFVEDKKLIAQLKHELFSNKELEKVKLRSFPKTAAYKRCFTLPRTTEATEIESILRALAPFISESLRQKKVVEDAFGSKLSDIVQYVGAVQYMPAYNGTEAFVALCRPLVFCEMGTNRPYAHSTVERAVYDCAQWLEEEFGIKLVPDMEPLPGGFMKVAGRYKMAPTARFCVSGGEGEGGGGYLGKVLEAAPKAQLSWQPERTGARMRLNSKFKPDLSGCFETVNEMKPGVLSLKDKTKNVQYMDTFLLESDEAQHLQAELEKERLEDLKDRLGDSARIDAEELYKERLRTSLSEAERLFSEGTVARVVYSGAKSYHMLVRVADSPKSLEEYKWLHAWLCNSLSDKIAFDECTSDPARLTRSPLTLPRTTVNSGVLVEGTQRLLMEDWSHVYKADWRDLYEAWKSRPLRKSEQANGRKLVPTRKEYKEAAEALLDGTFWTDSKWDGDRQRCFFPAYRVLRLLGYTHKQLWDEGMAMKGIGRYGKPDEIGYWKSRARCKLIQDIDEEIDQRDSEEEGGV